MLVSATTLLALALPFAAAQSSSVPAGAAVGTTTMTTTTTVAPKETGGNTMQTTDLNSRLKFINQLNYKSLKALAAHKIVAPNATSWFICGSTNAVLLDAPVPSGEKGKNATNLAFMISPPNQTEDAQLLGKMYPINSAYAGHNTTVFNWTDGSCLPGAGYYLAAVDKDCIENTTTPIQGCIWAVSDTFEFKAAGSMPSLPLPKIKENGASAFGVPLFTCVGAVVAAAALIL